MKFNNIGSGYFFYSEIEKKTERVVLLLFILRSDYTAFYEKRRYAVRELHKVYYFGASFNTHLEDGARMNSG